MNTLILKGKPVSDELRSKLKIRVAELASNGIIPKLAAVLVGNDPASQVYVRNKAFAFEKLNWTSIQNGDKDRHLLDKYWEK